jgi:hypothetical protein
VKRDGPRKGVSKVTAALPDSRPTKVRCWRWRRNPLRRRSDLIEAWIVLTACLVTVIAALGAAFATGDAVSQALARQRAERHTVSAVLTENASNDARDRAVGNRHVLATVRWTASDGSRREDRTWVPPGTTAGTTVTIWITRHGNQTTQPVTGAEAAVTAGIFGTMAAAAAGSLVQLGALAIRQRIDRQRMRRWEEEWQRIDTRWGRRTG